MHLKDIELVSLKLVNMNISSMIAMPALTRQGGKFTDRRKTERVL